MKLLSKFALFAAGLPLMAGGCVANSQTADQTQQDGPTIDIVAETLQQGDFLEDLPDGLHKLTFSVAAAGPQPENVECLVIKDKGGGYSNGFGFVGMDCKW